MGFALSILYLITYYLTPVGIFGAALGAAHIELILAAFAFFVSVPELLKSSALKTLQALAIGGLAMAVVLSILFSLHWLGGAVQAFLGFIPNAFAYFLVCLNCNSKKKLKILVLMLLVVCLSAISQGYFDQLMGVTFAGNVERAMMDRDSVYASQWNAAHPYLMAMRDNDGVWFFRLRGLGDINDPNDFAQLIVCLIPLMFIFWRPKKTLLNILCVILPVSALIFGAYLTHSRGFIVAFIATVILAVRRRVGTIPALLLAGCLFAASLALHVSGGRDISTAAGEDRMDQWGEGLELLKTHPLFGVGYGHFAGNSVAGLTAHNSIVVCAAELGLIGLFCWCLLLLPTVRDALIIASPAKVVEGEPIQPEVGLFPQAVRKTEVFDKAEINRLGRLVVLSLTGFLVAGLFLSRAYVLTLFLLCGIAEVVYEIALRQGMVAPRLRLGPALQYAAGLTISLLIGMYVWLRVMNLTR